MPKPWIKVHIEFLDNPKIMTLSLSLRGVWFTALAVAERFNRGGLLPSTDRFALMARMDDETTEKAFAALVKKGLLDETADGYRIHDWQVWQARKPSDEPEAVAARQAKWRAEHRPDDVTQDNALRDVTETRNAHNATKRIKSESEKEKREETPPEVLRTSAPSRGQRGARMPADWPTPVDLDEMDAYGESLGIGAGDVASHVREFADYWQAATKNATSMDWVKRWRSRFSQDVREGKVGGNARAPNGAHRGGRIAQNLTDLEEQAQERASDFRDLFHGNGGAHDELPPGAVEGTERALPAGARRPE